MTTHDRPGSTRRPVRKATVRIGEVLAPLVDRVDAADAWETPLRPGDATDASSWNAALSSSTPRWVGALLALRDRIVRIVGLREAGGAGRSRGFPVLASTDQEIVTGIDDSHLDFRVSTRVTPERTVVVTTTVTLHNGVGRLYWAVVRFFHPVVVRAGLRGLGRVERAEGPVAGASGIPLGSNAPTH